MPSYPHSYLYVSDPFNTPQELINGARTAHNMQAAELCGSGQFDNVLDNLGCDGYAYQPTLPPVLSEAVLWLDALDGTPTREYAPNRGTGGPALTGTLGATTASSTDQPLWLGGTEKYLYLPGDPGDNATLPDSAPLQITGDIEVVVRVSLTDWTPSLATSLVAKYGTAAAGYEVQINTDGTIRFIARLAASDITVASTVAIPATAAVADRDLWIKVTRATGSGTVTFWYATGGTNIEPPVFTQLGAAVVSTTGTMTAGSQTFYMGERNGVNALTGKLYRVMVRGAIAATTPVNVVDVDFTTNTSQSSFTATAGGVVTINRGTSGRKAVAYQGRPLWLFGSDDFINVPDHSLLGFAANESLTIVAVMRSHNVAVGSVRAIAGTAASAGGTGYALWNGTAATTIFGIGDSVFSPSAATGNKTASALHVVGGVRNTATDSLIAYLDGAASAPTTDTTLITLDAVAPFRIGTFSGGASPIDAEIMAVLVWRRALTDAEMVQVSSFFKGTPALAGRCWTTVDFGVGTDPWYDYRLPESLEAYGFIVEEWTGLDGGHNVRATSPTGQNRGGAYFGPQSHNMRTWKMNVLLHGSSERGLEYLFRWLESKLLNCCGSDCDTQFAWIRTVCPSDPISAPEEGVLRAERVVLLEGPTWEAPPVERAGCFLRRVSFTLGVGDPCLYRETEPLAFAEVTASGQGTSIVVKTNCATFAGNQLQVRAPFSGPAGFGMNAPVVTLSSPAQTILSSRAGLPVLRIAGYLDPYDTGVACSANLIGELIVEGYETSGYDIVIDMAKRKIRMRPQGTVQWLDGSRLLGRALTSGLTRWWSFGPCDSGFVVVEPAYPTLATARSAATLTQVTQWSVGIESATRVSCC